MPEDLVKKKKTTPYKCSDIMMRIHLKNENK